MRDIKLIIYTIIKSFTHSYVKLFSLKFKQFNLYKFLVLLKIFLVIQDKGIEFI